MVPEVTEAALPATDAAVVPPLRRATDPDPVETNVALRSVALNPGFGATHAVRDVALDFPAHEVTAIIGPSGCGKSTLLRCLNRMHETVPLARVSGQVLFHGQDIYAEGVNPITLRRHVGMVFQRPTPFPTMSIRDNVAAGPRLQPERALSRRQVDEVVERALCEAALWDEVKDRLRTSATG